MTFFTSFWPSEERMTMVNCGAWLVHSVRLWQRLNNKIINDVTELIKCVPINKKVEKSLSDGVTKVFNMVLT